MTQIDFQSGDFAAVEAKLSEALASFRKEEDGPDRELLLRAFAAQRTVDWPALEALF